MPESAGQVWWDTVEHQQGEFRLFATATGLCWLALPGEPKAMAARWIGRHLPAARLVRDPRRMAAYARELLDYLEGRRQDFTIPLDLRGTAFQERVWQALRSIPYGTVLTYAGLARRLGHPSAARAVGAACGANPVPVVVPCHRVVGTRGDLTGYRGGIDLKALLLRLERDRQPLPRT